VTRLKANKDLDAVRSRPDFQKLLDELEKKSKPGPCGAANLPGGQAAAVSRLSQ
jgi:hypothetical protein